MKIEFNKSQNNSLGLFLGFTGYIIFVVLDSLIKKNWLINIQFLKSCFLFVYLALSQ